MSSFRDELKIPDSVKKEIERIEEECQKKNMKWSEKDKDTWMKYLTCINNMIENGDDVVL